MENLNLILLSKALGEVARGFKHLKMVVDGVLASGQKLPAGDENVPAETTEDQEENGSFTPATTRLPDPPTTLTDLEIAKYLHESRVELPEHLAQELFDHVLQKTVRADRFHNQWVKDPDARKGWRKISEVQLETYRQHVRNFHHHVLYIFYNLTYDQFMERHGEIHESKYARLHHFEQIKFEKKLFRKLCCGTHAALEPLR